MIQTVALLLASAAILPPASVASPSPPPLPPPQSPIAGRTAETSWNLADRSAPERRGGVLGPGLALRAKPAWNGTLQGGSVPRTLSLAKHPGLCLDAPVNVAAGSLLQLWECNGHTNQLWLFDAGAWKIQYFPDPSKCIDAGDMKQGTALKLWDCNGLNQQKWGYAYNTRSIYLNTSIVDGGLCMDSYAPVQGGNRLHVWVCNGYDQQQYNVLWGTTVR